MAAPAREPQQGPGRMLRKLGLGDLPSALEALKPFSGARVVIAGCGGGCDVFGGVVPLAVLQAARDPRLNVALVNLSFTPPRRLAMSCKPLGAADSGGAMYRVDPGTQLTARDEYFPEARLATALQLPVYAFHGHSATVASIAAGYADLFDAVFAGEAPDLFLLVDGGCDAVLTGRETGLATPVEDMMHLRAVEHFLPRVLASRRGGGPTASAGDGAATWDTEFPVTQRMVLCLGMDVDCGHGVVYDELLHRLREARASGSLVAATCLSLEDDAAARTYVDAVKACHPVSTIVQSLVVAALEGHRGTKMPQHLQRRTGPECRFPISDLTCTLFAFDMATVAAEVTYLHRVGETVGIRDMCAIVDTVN